MSQQTKYTIEEWRAEAARRFGEDFMQWKFVCPVCEFVASVQDYKDAGAPPRAAGFSCIGRYKGVNPDIEKCDIGPNGKQNNGSCNYAGGGLFKLNPVTVVDPDGAEIQAFAFAE